MYKQVKPIQSLMKKCSTIILAMGLGFGVVPSAMASFDPIEELTELAELIKIYNEQKKMYDTMVSSNDFLEGQLNTTIDQLGIETDHWEAIQKIYNLSLTDGEQGLISLDSNVENTELWSSSEWDDALQDASGGDNNRYKELRAMYKTNNPNLRDNDASAIDIDQLDQAGYENRIDTTNKELAASQYTYEDIDNRVKNLKTLMKMIDKPELNTNEKVAIDINSRLVAEIGLIQVEMLRMQSIQAHADAEEKQEMINHETIEKKMLGLS